VWGIGLTYLAGFFLFDSGALNTWLKIVDLEMISVFQKISCVRDGEAAFLELEM
jgi:hypothetical protein